MAMGSLGSLPYQTSALVWKNFVIKRRHYCATMCEIILPVLFIVLLVGVRRLATSTSTTATIFVSNRLPFSSLNDTTAYNSAFAPGAGFNLQNFATQCMIMGSRFAVVPQTADTLNYVNFLTSQYASGGLQYFNGKQYNTPGFSNITVYFPTNADLEAYVGGTTYRLPGGTSGLCGAIVFTNIVAAGTAGAWSYNLRFNGSSAIAGGGQQPRLLYNFAVPNTFRAPVDETSGIPDQTWWLQYAYSGFLSVQMATDSWIAYRTNNNVPVEIDAQVLPMPTYANTTDNFFNVISFLLPLFVTLLMLYSFSRLVVQLVTEKESRIKEGLKIIGMSSAAYYLSWFITYAIMFGLTSLLITALAVGGKVFPNSSFGLVFLYFWLFGLASISMAFLLTVFFSQARAGSIVGSMIYFGLYFIFYAIATTDTYSTKMATCLSAPACFALTLQPLLSAESNQVGMRPDTANIVFDNFTFNSGLGMFIVDMVLYFILAVYLDAVVPQQYGTRRHPLFFLHREFWCGRPAKTDFTITVANESGGSDSVEGVTQDLRQLATENRCIQLKNLRKQFSESKVAVDDLDLTMYEGQIFALLGHNGAGKTTTCSMLTGLIESSAGDATVFGQSINSDMDAVRNSLGLCPQHDVLWADLTVYEHLYLVAALKGMQRSLIDEAVETKITEVGLREKRDTISSSLSGGMKRKLSVAMAFVSDSKFVVLDEPTSGMDPFSRRFTWNMLKNNKKGRVIILTTHFMDEADVLGDRIAIMSHGKLKCCGSALFLKSHFGVGYSLTISKTPSCNVQALTSAVVQEVPSAEFRGAVGSEVVFKFPSSESDRFANLFRKFDINLSGYGINSYGISATTLEEVFLQIAHADEMISPEQRNEDKTKLVDAAQPLSTFGARPSVILDENILFVRHFQALFRKRFQYSKRDYKTIICEVIIPVAVVLLGVALLTFASRWPYNAPILLSSSMFNARQGLPYPLPFNNNFNGTSLIGNVPSTTGYQDPRSYAQNASNQAIADALTDFSYGLLADFPLYKASRYGAFVVTAYSKAIQYSYAAFQNMTCRHTAPIHLNIANNAILKDIAGSQASISATTFPLPYTYAQKTNQQALSALTIAMMTMVAYACIPATLVAYAVKERELGIKHQQLVSGVSLNAYWLSSYAFDCTKYLVTFSFCVMIILAFQINEFLNSGAWLAVVLLFLFFGPAATAFTYVASFAFTSHSTAQTYMLLFAFVTGLIFPMVCYFLKFLSSTQPVVPYLVYTLSVIPSFAFGQGFFTLAMRLNTPLIDGSPVLQPLDLGCTGTPILYMALEGVVYLGLVLLIEYYQRQAIIRASFTDAAARRAIDQSMLSQPHPDDDVVTEADRVAKMGVSQLLVRFHNVKQCYPGDPPKLAIRQLSFGVQTGECFGLLGINGAGKTSAFRILTGEYLPSEGEASIATHDVVHNLAQARQMIGYCPQFDALLDLMTGREHLYLYGLIKGLRDEDLEHAINEKLDTMDLRRYADRPAGEYSGGNKRKLSVALATIGAPPVVFLDEPSTGVDPVARRFLWDVIARMISQGTSVVLTTHSMEEAEALSTRIGIMVGGRFRCLGSPQHLKSKFGQGYELVLKVILPPVNQIQSMVQRALEQKVDSSAKAASDVEKLFQIWGQGAIFAETVVQGNGLRLVNSFAKDGPMSLEAVAEWFLLEMHLRTVQQFVRSKFHGAVVLEQHASMIRFRLPRASSSLPVMFEEMQNAKRDLGVDEYSVSQTTLEMIFNAFAAQQDEELGVAAGTNFRESQQ